MSERGKKYSNTFMKNMRLLSEPQLLVLTYIYTFMNLNHGSVSILNKPILLTANNFDNYCSTSNHIC